MTEEIQVPTTPVEAADLGGRMGGAGRYWLLLPKGVTK